MGWQLQKRARTLLFRRVEGSLGKGAHGAISPVVSVKRPLPLLKLQARPHHSPQASFSALVWQLSYIVPSSEVWHQQLLSASRMLTAIDTSSLSQAEADQCLPRTLFQLQN